MYKYYIIYKITNLINNKIYIGKHRCNNLDDDYFGSGKILWQAINKYGIENFIFHLEFVLHNQEEMDLLEHCVVNEEFLKRNDVYNISRGGCNPCMYGKNNPFYGKTHSDEFKQKVSSMFKGKHISEAHKKKISKSLKKLYTDHPEIKIKFASLKNKKKCINTKTHQVSFFNIDNIPDDFEIYINRHPVEHVSEQQKLENKLKQIERQHNSRWYTDGIHERFCVIGQQPDGFVLGRLPTTNVGRKYSDETKQKMSLAKKGKTPSNKGKCFITDGVHNKYVSKDYKLPDGWRYGLSRRNTKNEIA